MSMLRIAFASTAPAIRAGTRAFYVSPVAGKSTTEKVNLKVGRSLASAIEKGEEATEATKETLAKKAKEVTGQASQKVNQTKAGVREGTQDFKEDVKKEARK
ncbi:hypothetical protein DAEQUDRAFT_384299 [Daedalea quercina L-15889]|uniref:Uncharacterized protein n=1 Tax=Daedalea quercina L-15889 TaxID=1314783 RepID=A0A165P170_9APHY|nr:hypothetical protein DAEQUDRAFT_384299 [Daedalea quercina L-15889]